VAWCDHECRWEYETDGLPMAVTADDLLARARYLTGFGHPPFRWHSRLWPSGLCIEQNEFLPGTDPLYVAEHGPLILSGTAGPADPNPAGITHDPATTTRIAALTAQLATDLAEAAALTRVAPDHIEPQPPLAAP
jgi:hypothetical protein